MPTTKDTLIDHLTTKEAIIGIVGLGYVGLPLMLRYNHIGYRVLGIDIDPNKVEQLNAGKSYIDHIAPRKIEIAIRSKLESTEDVGLINQCNSAPCNVPLLRPTTPRSFPRRRESIGEQTIRGRHQLPKSLASTGRSNTGVKRGMPVQV